MNRRFVCLAAALLALGTTVPLPAAAADPATVAHPSRPYTLVNRTFDSVTAVAVANAGNDAFEDIALGEALQGGLTSTTVHMPAGRCQRDVRVTFRDRRQQTFSRVDVCRSGGLSFTATGGSHGRTIHAEQLTLVDKREP